jgi:hypothetical protein
MRRLMINAVAMFVIGVGALFLTEVPVALAAQACCTSGDGSATCCGDCCSAGPTSCKAGKCESL